MKKKMAFVDLTNFVDWPMGGMIQYELSILPYLCNHYDVDLWGVSVNGKVNKKIVIDNKQYPINVWTNCSTGFRILPNYWKGLNLIKKMKYFDKYDIIYAHTGSCIIPFLNKKEAKIVYHQHGLMYRNDSSMKTRLEKPFMKLAQKKSDIVFVVSGKKSTEEFYNKNNFANIFVSVDSPVEFTKDNETSYKAKKEKNYPQNYIYTGRLTRFKNVSYLVDVFKEYLKLNSKAKLTIIGNGEEYKNIQNKISKYNLENSIRLLGKIPHDEIKHYLINNDVFLMPSLGEGVSVSVAEANTYGLPVIAQNVIGLNEQIINNVNGIICEKNNIFSFVNAIKQVNEEWSYLVDSSYRYAAKYNSQHIAQKIIDTIDSI